MIKLKNNIGKSGKNKSKIKVTKSLIEGLSFDILL